MTPEIGYQSDTGQLRGWGWMIDQTHETNPDLMWPESINVFDRMRSEDAQVASVLRAVTLPIISTDWEIDPAGADEHIVEHIAEDFGLPIKGRPRNAPLRTRGRFSWADHLRLALLELDFGHSFFEQVYHVDDRGLAHLHKLAWRPPRTIAKVNVARDGGLESIQQHGSFGQSKPVVIKVGRLVVYVNAREGGNWLGRSVLRPAYKNWLIKDRLMRIQVLAAERNGLGIPVHKGAPAPDLADAAEAKAWHEEQIEAGLEVATSARAGEESGVGLAHGADLSFIGVTGRLPDTDKPIRYHDEQIARAVLAHFLNLGTETGSWALGSTFANFFTDSLNAVAQHIADITQQHVIEDIVDTNWGPTARAPRIVPAKIGAEHPATAEAVKALLDCGALTADPALEAHLRALHGLPPLDAALVAKGVPVDTVLDAAAQREKAS